MKTTILERNLEKAGSPEILVYTQGWTTTRKGSNVYNAFLKLKKQGLVSDISEIRIIEGAKRQRASQGRKLALVRA